MIIFKFQYFIILCLGIFNLGNIFQELLIKKNFFISFRKKNYFFSPIIGAYLIILFLYPIIIFEISSKFFINFIAYFLFFISILKLSEIKKVLIFLTNQIKSNKEFFIFFYSCISNYACRCHRLSLFRIFRNIKIGSFSKRNLTNE